MVERVGNALGREVAGTVLFDHPSVDALANWLLDDLKPVAAPPQPKSTPQPMPTVSDVASMSEEEAAAALLAELDDL